MADQGGLETELGVDETALGDVTQAAEGGAPEGSASRLDRSGPAALERGESVGRYVVIARLGEGGMGVVYAAYDPELDRKVAIKLLRPKVGGRDIATARLQREAKAMAKLAHPNVVAIHDVGVHGEQVWLAMAFVAGQTLRDWIDAGPRPFAAVWPCFRQAGLGLAAAHEAGLVHRDFKPANVLLGAGGLVQVTDFGLARLEGEEDDRAESSLARDLGPAALTSSITLSSRVTQTGAFVGTPAYMAPEQFSGAAVDARTDQFAFAITLWEALCGERPFAAESAAALMFAVLRGKLREPPRGADMSRRVRAALTRALAKEPADRFASMTELLAALEPPQRRLGWAVVGLSALLIGGGLWLGLGHEAPPPAAATTCRGDDPAVAALWNQDRRTRLKASLAALDAPFAADTAARTVADLDAWTLALAQARILACEDTHVRGVQSEQLLDLRTTCLDRRVRRLGEVLTVLEQADVTALRRAGELVRTLDDLDTCADRGALTAGEAPPSDPAARAALADLEAEIDRTATLRLAGRYAEGETAGAAAVASADRLGHAPSQAEARHELGRILSILDREPEAQALQLAAFDLALAHGEDRLAARAAASLVTSATELKDEAGVELWYGIAEAELARIGGAPKIRAALLLNYGNARFNRNRFAEALALYREAHRLYAEQYGPRSMVAGDALHSIGRAQWRMGDLEEAARQTREALEIWREHVGDEHPRVTLAMSALVIFEMQAGHGEAAMQLQRQVVDRTARLYGDDGMNLAYAYVNLAAASVEGGSPEEARRASLRAAELYRVNGQDQDRDFGRVLGNLSTASLLLGQLDEALAQADAAIAIMQPTDEAPEPDPLLAVSYIIRGEAHVARGELAAGRRDFARAIAMAAEPGVAAVDVAEARINLADVQVRSDELVEAAATLAEIDALAETDPLPPKLCGELEAARLRLAWAKDDEPGAAAAMAAARAAYAETGKAGREAIAKLAAEFPELAAAQPVN